MVSVVGISSRVLKKRGILGGLVALMLVPPVFAEEIVSTYTPLDLDQCENVTPPEMAELGAIFHCEGFDGQKVQVAEGDLRMYVSYGPNADKQTASSQTIPPFNTVGEVLEWRLDEGQPFATILRYRWSADGRKGSTLVVTKLGSADTCHVAYVPADRIADANELARRIADEVAPGFSCEQDKPRTYGQDGAPVE